MTLRAYKLGLKSVPIESNNSTGLLSFLSVNKPILSADIFKMLPKRRATAEKDPFEGIRMTEKSMEGVQKFS